MQQVEMEATICGSSRRPEMLCCTSGRRSPSNSSLRLDQPLALLLRCGDSTPSFELELLADWGIPMHGTKYYYRSSRISLMTSPPSSLRVKSSFTSSASLISPRVDIALLLLYSSSLPLD